jgi:hypothetical protein
MDQSWEERGSGWIGFAAVMLLIGGTFAIIDGIIGLARSSFYAHGTRYVFSDARTWAWIILVLGILLLLAGFSVAAGGSFGRWFGIFAAGVYGIGELMAAPHYPLWSLCMFAVSILIIYALVVYGGRPTIASG